MTPPPFSPAPQGGGAVPAAGIAATRLESDSLGTIAVPAEHYWGAQTQRSLHFFPFGQRMPLAVVHGFGQLKAACAEVNLAMGKLAPELAAAIVVAAPPNTLSPHANTASSVSSTVAAATRGIVPGQGSGVEAVGATMSTVVRSRAASPSLAGRRTMPRVAAVP
jgi:hypothetical protein